MSNLCQSFLSKAGKNLKTQVPPNRYRISFLKRKLPYVPPIFSLLTYPLSALCIYDFYTHCSYFIHGRPASLYSKKTVPSKHLLPLFSAPFQYLPSFPMSPSFLLDFLK